MKKKIIKLVFFLIIVVGSFSTTILWLNDLNIDVDEKLLDILIDTSNRESDKNKIVNTIVKTITDSDLINPASILMNKYNTKETTKNKEPTIENKVIAQKSEPIVYIYNTHQVEKYNSSLGLNINYSVIDAANSLKDKLNSLNIESIVEKGSITDILNTNGWSYSYSYKVSRMYLESAKKNNPSLNFFIDLHRDSVPRSITTKEINGKSYARVLFVLGLENSNYKQNEININKLNKYLNDNYNGLSRGILERKGKGVNGLYNQDFSPRCILIEIGGEENTMEEVENTIEVISKMIYLFVSDKI